MITVCGKSITRGSKEIVFAHVAKDLGMDVNITAHVLAGHEEGPTLLILSMLHGEEWFSMLFIRELVKRINLDELKGTIIAVPVANTSAFHSGTRCLMDNSDEPDANRSFDGNYNWLSNQITRTIEQEFFTLADFLIDYHIGSWGDRMADIGFGSDYEDPKSAEISRGMGFSYAFPVLHNMDGNPRKRHGRSSRTCAGDKYNIPGIVPEIGGLGFGQKVEDAWMEDNLRGIFSNLRYLGMLPGEPEYCDKYLQIKDYWRVSPKNGGYLELALAESGPLTEVHAGQVLARIIDPETFAVLEELTSPGDGYIFYGCRNHMVRPGGWVFGVTGKENSCWVDKDGNRLK